MLRISSVLFIVQLSMTLLVSPDLHACTCEGEGTLKQSFKRADFVAVVQVIDVVSVPVVTREDKERFRGVYKFRVTVETLFKGHVSKDTVFIYSPPPGECTVNMVPGKRYIVYCYKHDFYQRRFKTDAPLKGRNIWWTNKCTRTKLYNEIEIESIKACRKRLRK